MTWKRWMIVSVGGIAVIVTFAAPTGALSQPRLAQRQLVEAPCPAEPGRVIECVRPSETDPAIRGFDDAHFILYDFRAKANADLLLFMTGTGGEPPGPRRFLQEAADAGYRIISLAYNDMSAVVAYCPRKPDPACSENSRRMRIYGDRTLQDGAIDNTAPESIVNRLVKLLQNLDRRHPEGGWASYLDSGSPNWRRIAFAGQSQGAGMAAFIAKEHEVARVILFSSPWDFVNMDGQRRLAAWLSMPSKTPADRWFAGYHARENTADLLAKAYAELKVPTDHIRVFAADLPPGLRQGGGGNPFHGQEIRNPSYAEQRAFLLGRLP
jgi:hypothetical protein